MKELIANLFTLQQLEIETGKLSAENPALRAHRQKIPDPILGHFDRLRARGKKGVALVRNGVCSECHMRLATGSLATLRQGSDIQLCATCGRYLYLPPEVAASPAEEPAAKPVRRKRKAKESLLSNA